MGRSESGARNAVVAGLTSGIASAIVSYTLNNYDIVHLDSAQIAVLASLGATIASLVILYFSYAYSRKSQQATEQQLYRLRKSLNALEASRVWGFRLVERTTLKLSLKDGTDEAGVSRDYIGKWARVKVEFDSSKPVDLFIEDSGYPIHRSTRGPWRDHSFPYRMQNVKKWSKDFDCENGFMFAVARLAKGTNSADVSVIISELAPVEGK